MGGVINVAIRFKDGRSFCVERWTNNTPFWFKHPKMFDGDEEYIQEYLDATRHSDFLVDDYLMGKPEPLRNSEYGLVVWDYLTGYHLDNNGYCGYTSFYPYELRMKDEMFTRMANAGRLRFHRAVYNPLPEGAHFLTKPTMAFEEYSDILTLEEAQRLAADKNTNEWGYEPDKHSITEFSFETDPLNGCREDRRLIKITWTRTGRIDMSAFWCVADAKAWVQSHKFLTFLMV